jgi:hypothetical protein
MKMVVPLMLFAMVAAVSPAVAQAPDQRRSDQARAYDARRKGEVLSPRAIEARVIPTMKGYEYLAEIHARWRRRLGRCRWPLGPDHRPHRKLRGITCAF